jgi:PIN domain nuclease of toxin-antitoxin system
MKIILDTRVFLWFISGDNRLSTEVRDSICNLDNQIYLSVVSMWESIVKYQLGK